MGYVLFIGCLLGIGFYFYLTFLSPWVLLVLQISVFLAVAAVLAILAWIGYALATTPPLGPLEEIEVESSKDEQN